MVTNTRLDPSDQIQLLEAALPSQNHFSAELSVRGLPAPRRSTLRVLQLNLGH